MPNSTAPVSFQRSMVSMMATVCDIRGATVYEVGSDPDLTSGGEFIRCGAKLVIATNLGTNWFRTPIPSGIMATSIDVRSADSVIGAESVDIVFGINILEHVLDIPTALSAIHKVLRQGGHFLLHGHPIWTSAAGHHVIWNKNGERYHFGDDTNPLPNFAHLYMSQDEMVVHLRRHGASEAAVARMVFDVFSSDSLNRTPLREIDFAFSASPLIVDKIVSNQGAALDAESRERVASTPWWNDEEKYGVRQISFLGHKPFSTTE